MKTEIKRSSVACTLDYKICDCQIPKKRFAGHLHALGDSNPPTALCYKQNAEGCKIFKLALKFALSKDFGAFKLGNVFKACID